MYVCLAILGLVGLAGCGPKNEIDPAVAQKMASQQSNNPDVDKGKAGIMDGPKSVRGGGVKDTGP